MISFLGGFYCRNIWATGNRSQLEVSPRGRRSIVSETSSVEEKNWGQATVDGWMDGRMEEISWQEQKDKWLWFGRKEWKSPHHFKYQACSERNREVQFCVTSGPTGVQKVQELKWRKLQNTKTTAQRTNRVKNERLKHNKSWSVSVVALLMPCFDLMSASVEDELVFLIPNFAAHLPVLLRLLKSTYFAALLTCRCLL